MTTLAPFLRKLWDMVNDITNESIISWLEDGDGFIIYKPRELSTFVLPKYFNGNMCSFVRQLNLYGFNKIGDEFVFKHNEGKFKRGYEENLGLIERRKNIKNRARKVSESGKVKQKKTGSLSHEYPAEVPQDDLISKLIQTNSSHEFMINLLITELQQQQRETANLKQQMATLTQVVLSQQQQYLPSNTVNSSQSLLNLPNNFVISPNDSITDQYTEIYPPVVNFPPPVKMQIPPESPKQENFYSLSENSSVYTTPHNDDHDDFFDYNLTIGEIV